jgi:hypothetical protein
MKKPRFLEKQSLIDLSRENMGLKCPVVHGKNLAIW